MKPIRGLLLPVAMICSFILGFILKDILSPSPVSTQQTIESGNYTVSYVLDGDTIEVEGGTRVRYEGIDAPEMNERFGIQAYELNKKLVDGKTITIELGEEKTDFYGRTLGYIYLPDGTCVNEKLIEEGYATALSYNKMKKPIYYEQFLTMEKQARQYHRGMWVQEWK